METEVLIVGAGPVGLTMAAELRRHGVSSRIIDAAAASGINVQSDRSALPHPGIAGGHGRRRRIVREGLRLTSAEFHAGAWFGRAHNFDEIDAPYPFILSLSQATTERLLTDCLSRSGRNR